MKLPSVRRKLRLKLKADIKNLDFARLVKRPDYSGLVRGLINVNISLSGAGASMRTIMAGLNGHLLTAMTNGRINNKMFTRLSGGWIFWC